MKRLAIAFSAILCLSGCGVPALMSGELFPEDAKLKRLEGKSVYYFSEDGGEIPKLSDVGFAHSDGACRTLQTQIIIWRNKNGLKYREDVSKEVSSVTITNGRPDFREHFCPSCVPEPY